jgi:hypothetical protein
MTRFVKYELIGGGTLLTIKKRGVYLDCYLTNSAEEILYLIQWFLKLLYERYLLNLVRLRKKKYWKILVKHHGEKCNYCGSTDNLTLDHIIPLSKGGINKIENFQILCKSCNKLKGNKYEL